MINTGPGKKADRTLTLILRFCLIWMTLALFPGCNEGNLGPEGKRLLPYLEPDKLKELVENPREDIWIIDTTPAANYQREHIPTARSFPSDTILSRLEELPKDKYLILYCETGLRAQTVLKELESRGYTKLMNWGGYTRWPWELKKAPPKAAEKPAN